MIQSVYESLLKLKQAERLLLVHKYMVLMVWVLALGALPYLSAVYQVLPTNAAFCFGMIVAYSLYVIFYYTKIRQQHRAIRYEVRFLEFHQDEEQYNQILLQDDHLWTDSITSSYLEDLYENSTLNNLSADSNAAFRAYFSPAFPNWLNFSPAFLLATGWLIFMFPARLNPTLATITQNLHLLAMGMLAAALCIELITIVMRYQTYQKAVHLEQWMGDLATTVLSPVFVEKHPYPLARVEVPQKEVSKIIPLIEAKGLVPPHPDAPTLNEILGTLQQNELEALPKLGRMTMPSIKGQPLENLAPTQNLNDYAHLEEKSLLDFEANKVSASENTQILQPVTIFSVNPPALPILAELNEAIHLKTIGKTRKPHFIPAVPAVMPAQKFVTEEIVPTPPVAAVNETFIARKILLADGTEAFIMEAIKETQVQEAEAVISPAPKSSRLKRRSKAKEEPESLPKFQQLERLV